jgi:pimeloyl-ACP methyl ester carboxylesterase
MRRRAILSTFVGTATFAAVCLTVLGAAPRAAAADWTAVKAAPIEGAPDIEHAAWSVARDPGGPFDRIEVHRYRTKSPAVATVLYLPGTNMNGEVAVPDENHNLWIFLARRGVEVFALDYRTRFASESTDASALTSLKGWTTETFVEDIKLGSAHARAQSGRSQVFVAGFSRGVFLAYAYACSEPQFVAGLVALDGQFKSHAPKNQYEPSTDLQKLETSSAWATDVSGRLGWEGRQKLMKATAADPKAPATDPKYKTLGEQVGNLLQFAWGPGGLANPLGGESRPEILARLLAGYDRFYPAIQDPDGRRIGDRDDDPKTTVDDLWGEMKTPILYFGNAKMPGDWRAEKRIARRFVERARRLRPPRRARGRTRPRAGFRAGARLDQGARIKALNDAGEIAFEDHELHTD